MSYKYSSSFALVSSLLLVATAVNAGEVTATGEVRLENGSEATSMFGMGLKAVEFSSDGKQLSFSVELDQDIVTYLKENMAEEVAQFFIDSDNDKTTGGEPFGSSQSGFESVTGVYACKEFDGGRVCAGDMGTTTGFIGNFETEAWNSSQGSFERVHDFGWNGGDSAIEGVSIHGAIPYEDIGGAPGATLRISVVAGTGREIDIPTVLLTLN